MNKGQFLSKLREKKFQKIIYFEANYFYYDLVSLYYEDSCEVATIPAPLLIEGEDDVPDLYEGDPFYASTMRAYIREKFFGETQEFEYNNRDHYQDFRMELETMREDKAFLENLSVEDREILSDWTEIVLETEENQFGETIVTSELYGNLETGFYTRELSCYSSSWAGMGICNCVSHPTYTEERVSAKEALSLIKKHRSHAV